MTRQELIDVGENWYERTKRLAQAQLNMTKPPEYRMRAMILYVMMSRRLFNVSSNLGWHVKANQPRFKEGVYVPTGSEEIILPRHASR